MRKALDLSEEDIKSLMRKSKSIARRGICLSSHSYYGGASKHVFEGEGYHVESLSVFGITDTVVSKDSFAVSFTERVDLDDFGVRNYESYLERGEGMPKNMLEILARLEQVPNEFKLSS